MTDLTARQSASDEAYHESGRNVTRTEMAAGYSDSGARNATQEVVGSDAGRRAVEDGLAEISHTEESGLCSWSFASSPRVAMSLMVE